jgi:hypothetical protein
VLSSMGLYDEAAEVLRESFTIKDDQIQAYLAGHLPASNRFYRTACAGTTRQYLSTNFADSAANAKTMKALLLSTPQSLPADEERRSTRRQPSRRRRSLPGH